MATLQGRMRAYLGQDWKIGLTPQWMDFFDGCDAPDIGSLPNVEILDQDLPFPFPTRFDLGGLQQQEEPVPVRHMLRAFDNLAPNRVRVVVLGQDPYPNSEKATGRAFEDGAWAGDLNRVADSLQALLTSAVLSARDDVGGHPDRAAWNDIAQEMARQNFHSAASMKAYFDGLSRQGVLFLNAAWTHTRKRDLETHLAFWKPITNHLLGKLASDHALPTVFLLLGEKAQLRFCNADPVCRCSAVVTNNHPSRVSWDKYYTRSNPLIRVNTALEFFGSQRIDWWPPANAVPA